MSLANILSSIEGMSVTGVSSIIYTTSLKDTIDIADIPIRIINPIGFASGRTRISTLGGSGHVMTTQWTVSDIALLRPAAMGIGLADIATTIEAYLQNYHSALRTLTSPTWSLSEASVRSSILEWPQASGKYYDAVTAILTISDIIQ
jgi:hypothetical protein